MSAPDWLKPGLTGAAAGAIAVSILGFSLGGWVTSGTAKKMAALESSAAAVTAMVPYCVAASRSDPNAVAVIEKLKAAESYRRDNVVMESGWATPPGLNQPNRYLASECAERLAAKMPK